MLLLRQRAGARAPAPGASTGDAAADRARRRAPKDPSKFASNDAIHAHREAGAGGGGGFISGLINAVSDRAFGYGGKGEAGGVGGAAAAALASLYRAYLRLSSSAAAARRASSSQDGHSLLDTSGAQTSEQSDALAALLSISRGRAAALARRHAPLLAVEPSELGRRVLALKAALPGCDVAALVEARPDLYLSLSARSGGGGVGEEEEERAAGGGERGDGAAAAAPAQSAAQAAPAATAAPVAGSALEALRVGLPGADVEEVAFEDPALLFHPPEKLARGIRRLRALWPDADEQALAASEPRHLALAVRALGEGDGDDDGGEGEGGDGRESRETEGRRRGGGRGVCT